MNLQIRRFGLGKSFDESFYDLFYLCIQTWRKKEENEDRSIFL